MSKDTETYGWNEGETLFNFDETMIKELHLSIPLFEFKDEQYPKGAAFLSGYIIGRIHEKGINVLQNQDIYFHTLDAIREMLKQREQNE